LDGLEDVVLKPLVAPTRLIKGYDTWIEGTLTLKESKREADIKISVNWSRFARIDNDGKLDFGDTLNEF
jgi:hypothetical protein